MGLVTAEEGAFRHVGVELAAFSKQLDSLIGMLGVIRSRAILGGLHHH
jgi:hypothetical protein